MTIKIVSNKKSIIIFSVLFMAFTCTSSGCISENEPKGPSLTVGDPLPVFSVLMNNGSIVSNESLKGKVSVIIFFNTNCSDCRKELPIIQQLWETYRENQGVEVVTISREESEKEILTYWKENSLTLPFSPQETREIYSLFASSIIPRIFIANPEGIIKAAYCDTDMPILSTLIDNIESLI